MDGWTGAEIEKFVVASIYDGTDEAFAQTKPIFYQNREKIEKAREWARFNARLANGPAAMPASTGESGDRQAKADGGRAKGQDMSHTMNIDIEIRDYGALLSACERLGVKVEERGSTGYALPSRWGLAYFSPVGSTPWWSRPDGTVAYDNYNGQWGRMSELNKLRAYYGLEKAKVEAHRKGYRVHEALNEETQEIELRIRVGEA